MAESDDYGLRNRPHISITAFREVNEYNSPSRAQKRKPLREDYTAHATMLLEQLTLALGSLSPPGADSRLTVTGLKPGAIVEVTTLPPAEDSRATATKIPSGLEFPTQEIVVLRSERNNDRTESALLFVPDDARDFLRNRILQYGRRDLDDQRRPNIDRFEILETVQAVSVEGLFIGEVDFSSSDLAWWELWVRKPDGFPDQLAVLARAANFDVHADRLIFPDTIVLFVHAAAREIAAFAGCVPGAITEIRQSTATIEPFLKRDGSGLGQPEWVEEFAGRITPPTENAPVVCTLDTGVSAAHPLLAPGLQGVWAYDAAWGTDDHHPQGGHGTGLASLVLYGDLEPLMSDARIVALTHAVESIKFLPPQGFPRTQPPSYGVVTQGAVGLVEAERPNMLRSFCLATSATAFSPERPSSWSGALDQIAAGSMPGDSNGTSASKAPKRLVLVATGNVQDGLLAEIMQPAMLEDPAQSWNALSVGGFTTKEQRPQPPPVLNPVVPANYRSPYSRGSQELPDDLTPIKPEVLFEAGNMLADEQQRCEWHAAVSLLAAGSNVTTEPLVPFWATSAAVGMAGNFAGRLQAALPQYWPETLRALTIDSAQWPQPIRKKLIGRGAHWKTGSKATKQHILREVGYGVPNLERAMLSARNDVTLIAEAEIQPFAIGDDASTAVFNEMHFYDLPWPKSALEQLENEIVTMKVTLSYFIEPNLTGKAATRPDTYRSFGLRFDMKKRTETKADFLGRVSANQERGEARTPREASYWLLGPKAFKAGSLHCDLWRGNAIDLAGHDAIVVYPVSGWWKSYGGQRRMTDQGRYSLVISIAAPGHAVDLRAEVVNLVELRVGAGEIEALPG